MDAVTEWFGAWFGAGHYEFARQMLQRGVAAIYVVAFLSTLAQFPALLGEHGLLPVPRYLARGGAAGMPTLFRLHYSDRMLRAVCVVGAVVAAALVAGLPQLGPPWLPLVAFLLLWILYLSIVKVGQTFYGFGWEMLLCEAGFLVAFLGSNEVAPPILVILLVRWLVFRLEFGAGMIKMRGDRSWRDLTALYYHHETQPMPNPLSRFAHLLPKSVHRMEVLGNHVAQLVVPFLLFEPQPVASIAAAVVILTQLWLVLTGNFAWLNVLTIVLAFGAVSDDAIHAIIPAMPATTSYSSDPAPLSWVAIVLIATALMVVLSWPPLRNLFSRRQLMNASFTRFSLVNAYGAFGSVTQERYEVVIEGSTAERPLREEDWRPYEFKGKPGDVRRIPGQFAPYHLRLDWLMWFLALGSPDSGWFRALLGKLLVADRATLRLLRHDPFDGEPPTWIRARVYLYRFASRSERRETGQWWMREETGELVAPSRLR
ncbi:lipase maturation factor family protein [Cnuibacter physcomitrellae]|uniref:lipase maturation factor family protein n=1 Tax=Cnuibacter physcomitrellae TaxID=1619308 RepID=UPI002176132A|nr:lipase maturation factor family protein [Cnuibacter physcomitrellae]MCS5498997.1 lipase maturation factor family protein [Cnuibacter physcomitrellae]